MSLLRRSHLHHAGDSAAAIYRAERRKAIRAAWKDWLILALITIAAPVGLMLTRREPQVLSAFILGVVITVAMVGWAVGGNVRNLPWLWGSLGEQDTERLLNRLGPDWSCEHDVPNSMGNWDHILIGPPGVFMLDTKRLESPAVAFDDGLRCGRLVYRGSSFRGSAAELKEQLEGRAGQKVWVQAVVVIWGDFAQRRHEEDKVVYLRAAELHAWLNEQPPRLSVERRAALIRAARELRGALSPASPELSSDSRV